MDSAVPFKEVLELFESYRWKLFRSRGPNRVFIKSGTSLVINIEVHDGQVKEIDLNVARKILEKIDKEDRGTRWGS